MEQKRILLTAIIIVLLSLALVSCGGGDTPATEAVADPVETTAGEPGEGTQAADGAGDPAVTGATVTDLKEIEGTWIAAAYPGNFVLTIFPDGRLSVATSLEDLSEGNTDTWQLTMEDGQIRATGFALCLGDVGSYVATLNTDGTMRFTSIIDPCDARLRKMDRSLPGRLNEYILIYNPVE